MTCELDKNNQQMLGTMFDLSTCLVIVFDP